MSILRLRLAFVFAALGSLAPLGIAAPAAAPAAEKAKPAAPRYPLHGTIVRVFPEKTTLMIKHEAIPGVLDAGTMAFRVEDSSVFKYAKKGQAVAATVIVRDDDFYLTDIQLSKR